MEVRSWTMLFQLFGQARGISKPSGRLLGWRRFSPGIGGRHAELAHIHGDGIEVRVSGTEFGDDWESPACGRSWMFVEEIPPASHLDIVELKHELDVLYRSSVSFLPVFLAHMLLVQVLEQTEPRAHGGSYKQ